MGKEVLKVHIEDYQNIKKVDLELEKGLTVLIGKTNDGKSSIMRAINDFIFNSGDDEDVRAGKKSYSIIMDNGDGKAEYKRSNVGKNKKSSYQINGGDLLTKVGRSQIEEISELFNITEVKLKNNQKVKLNFWFQQEKPFLTDKTDTQLFEFLSLSSSEEFIKVLKTMKDDTKEVSASINKTATSIDTIKEVNNRYRSFLAKNKDFDTLYNKTVVVNNSVHKLNEYQVVVDRIDNFKSRFIDKRDKHSSVKEIYDSLSSFMGNISNDVDYVVENTKFIADVGSLVSSIDSRRSRLKVADDSLSDYQAKLDRIDLTKVSNGVAYVTENSKVVSELSVLISSVSNKSSKLKLLENELSDIKMKDSNLDLEGFKRDLEIINELNEKIRDINSVVASINNIKSKHDQKVQEEGQVRQIFEQSVEEVKKLELEMGYCPLCGSDLGGEKHGC